ncbi:MAG: ATP-binding protein [Candidatus Palauibacterales bacterium]|nr:ATP-binding protein [Candidatus Palauibacterales bacterium]
MLRTSRSDRRAATVLEPLQVLYWIYAARLVISLAVFGSAILVGDFLERQVPGSLPPEFPLIAIVGLATAAFLTPIAYRISHRKGREIGLGFLYSQAALDVLLVNGIVHITGGSGSPFVSLFIGLAAGYALVLPLSSAILTALSAGVLYLFLNLTGGGDTSSIALLLQLLVIMLVAVTASFVGARFRQVRSELRSVEGELHRLRLDTADVLRNIPSGVITLDASGNLVYMNLAAAELCGLDGTRLLGQDLLPELQRRAPEVAATVRETMKTGRGVYNREADVLAPSVPGAGGKGGDPVPVAVSTTMLQDVGAGPSHVVLLQDLRAVRQLENLRLRTGKLEAVAELSASLAHELKNPLASVRSAVEQLSRRAAEDEDEQILGRLIVREADRLSRILGEFSDFARVGVAERKPVDVDRLIAEVIETVRRHPAAEGRATITAEVLDDMGGLWGDPELLHRTLLNLVLNAVQVGKPEEKVTVRVVADALRPDLVPSEVSLGHPVRIRVIDDGPGIAAEDLSRIFDPFYTRRAGGSGLGLSIAHRAVQAHGGALIASSNPGDGATFAIVLPRRTGKRRPAVGAFSTPDQPPARGPAENGSMVTAEAESGRNARR